MAKTKEDYIREYLESAARLGINLDPPEQAIIKTAEMAWAVDNYIRRARRRASRRATKGGGIMVEPYRLTVTESEEKIRNGQLTPIELVESLLDRITELEPRLDAWVTVDAESAMRICQDPHKGGSGGEAEESPAWHPRRSQGHLQHEGTEDDDGVTPVLRLHT